MVNGIPYYSFSGVGTITNGLDPTDYLLALTSRTFDKGDANDGLVSACSSRLGYVISDDYKMNHLDSTNQFIGLVAWGGSRPSFSVSQPSQSLKKSRVITSLHSKVGLARIGLDKIEQNASLENKSTKPWVMTMTNKPTRKGLWLLLAGLTMLAVLLILGLIVKLGAKKRRH